MIGRCADCAAPAPGDESAEERIIVLDAGRGSPAREGGLRRAPRFSWRASTDRVEIYGEDPAALLRGAYDFLRALGVRWPEPGPEGERLPNGPLLELDANSGASADEALPATLILGHGAFLEDWEDRLAWAARVGYSSVFIHTTPEALALGAAPQALYETLRPGIARAASRLGLRLELGGHALSSFLPRALFKFQPELFRESGGLRVPDRNLCPSSARALSTLAERFAAFASAHPEISVFHAWPDDLPGGGWCSCPSCAGLSPAAQSLAAARALAESLAAVRPDAALSFLAYHDSEDIAAALASSASLPPRLELLWAPRKRSWGQAIGDASSALNAASLAAFRKAASAWRRAGGGRVAVFEYYEDAVLFKGAVPPLSSVIEGDLAAYRGGDAESRADAIEVLCTGGRLPLAPRPNLALLPELAAAPAVPDAPRAPTLLADWARAAYGAAARPMQGYWRELEAAWTIDLDIEEGEGSLHMPDSPFRGAIDPPVDWGDPWAAGLPRLAAKRDRCEELFDHLRSAEASLAKAKDALTLNPGRETRAVLAESNEYSISGAVLELNCARLSTYHELAGGDARAAADVANLALSASGAVRRALRRLPDRRARREIGLLIGYFYDLRLRSIRRANARSAVRRLFDLWLSTARLGIEALRATRTYEP